MLLKNATYAGYIKGIISLARSIVIKSPHTITKSNSYLQVMGDTLSEDPRDWKYYKNLAGLRYVGTSGLNDDPILTVFSVDKNIEIEFNRQTMVSNPLTLANYKAKDQIYINLLAKYPASSDYINGVINPINITTAINAADWQILGWDTSFISSNETTLIKDLQAWINNFVTRWDVPGYNLSDPLYASALSGILVLNIVLAIINIRLKNIKTPQVHPFHLWSYLGGYFNLNKYSDKLTFSQAYFLYRNIEHLVFHAGKQETFDFLFNALITPSKLDIYGYNMINTLNGALDQLNSGNYTELNRSVLTERISLKPDNKSEPALGQPSELVEKMLNLAILNPQNHIVDINSLTDNTSFSILTNIPTKVIEGSPNILSSANLVNVGEELINNWLYLTALGRIKYNYTLSIPSENISEVVITAKDAAVILMYASAKYYNVLTTVIPKPYVHGVMWSPVITDEDINNIVEERFLRGIEYTGDNLGTVQEWDRYSEIVNSLVLPKNIVSPDAFSTYIARVVKSKLQHKLIIGLENSGFGKSQLNNLIKVFYRNYQCDFAQENTYADFFTNIGFDLTDVSKEGLLSLIENISTAYFGDDVNNDNLLYDALLAVMKTLTSYELSYVTNLSVPQYRTISWVFLTGSTVDITNNTNTVYIGAETNILGNRHRLPLPIIDNINYSIKMPVELQHNDLLNLATALQTDQIKKHHESKQVYVQKAYVEVPVIRHTHTTTVNP